MQPWLLRGPREKEEAETMEEGSPRKGERNGNESGRCYKQGGGKQR